MNSQVKQLKAQLKKLNGLQWSKKIDLNKAIKELGAAQRRLHKNSVVMPSGTPHEGARYVPLAAVQSFCYHTKRISRLTKDMNIRRNLINDLESQLRLIRNTVYYVIAKNQRTFWIHLWNRFLDEDSISDMNKSKGIVTLKSGTKLIYTTSNRSLRGVRNSKVLVWSIPEWFNQETEILIKIAEERT